MKINLKSNKSQSGRFFDRHTNGEAYPIVSRPIAADRYDLWNRFTNFNS